MAAGSIGGFGARRGARGGKRHLTFDTANEEATARHDATVKQTKPPLIATALFFPAGPCSGAG